MRESWYYLVGVCAGFIIGTLQGCVWGFVARGFWDDGLHRLFDRLTKKFRRETPAERAQS